MDVDATIALTSKVNDGPDNIADIRDYIALVDYDVGVTSGAGATAAITVEDVRDVSANRRDGISGVAVTEDIGDVVRLFARIRCGVVDEIELDRLVAFVNRNRVTDRAVVDVQRVVGDAAVVVGRVDDEGRNPVGNFDDSISASTRVARVEIDDIALVIDLYSSGRFKVRYGARHCIFGARAVGFIAAVCRQLCRRRVCILLMSWLVGSACALVVRGLGECCLVVGVALGIVRPVPHHCRLQEGVVEVAGTCGALGLTIEIIGAVYAGIQLGGFYRIHADRRAEILWNCFASISAFTRVHARRSFAVQAWK